MNDIDIIIVGNKFDLLPNTGYLFEKSIRECLIKHCEDKGIQGSQIKYVELVSAKTGFQIERLITKMFKIWNDDGNVYLLGMANAGKSVLFNQLLSSDYCHSLASQAIVRATTSFWPGTTLNTLKFPIKFLNKFQLSKRTKRLYNDSEELDKLLTKMKAMYKKTSELKYTEPIGIVGSTFKPLSSLDADEINIDVDSTYSVDTETGQISEGKNYEDSESIEKESVDEARAIYNPNKFKGKAAWLYDTPGVL